MLLRLNINYKTQAFFSETVLANTCPCISHFTITYYITSFLHNHPPVFMAIQILRLRVEPFKREASTSNGSAYTGQQNSGESVLHGIQAVDSGIPVAQNHTHHHFSMISYTLSNENSQNLTFFILAMNVHTI